MIVGPKAGADATNTQEVGAMSQESWRGPVPDPRLLSKQELHEAIAELETERATLEAERCVVLWRIAFLQVERAARDRDTHFDPAPIADAVLRRLPTLLSALDPPANAPRSFRPAR